MFKFIYQVYFICVFSISLASDIILTVSFVLYSSSYYYSLSNFLNLFFNFSVSCFINSNECIQDYKFSLNIVICMHSASTDAGSHCLSYSHILILFLSSLPWSYLGQWYCKSIYIATYSPIYLSVIYNPPISVTISLPYVCLVLLFTMVQEHGLCFSIWGN